MALTLQFHVSVSTGSWIFALLGHNESNAPKFYVPVLSSTSHFVPPSQCAGCCDAQGLCDSSHCCYFARYADNTSLSGPLVQDVVKFGAIVTSPPTTSIVCQNQSDSCERSLGSSWRASNVSCAQNASTAPCVNMAAPYIAVINQDHDFFTNWQNQNSGSLMLSQSYLLIILRHSRFGSFDPQSDFACGVPSF